MQDLGALGRDTSDALKINPSGQVTGTSVTATGETHAFFWSSGTMQDIGTLDAAESAPVAINASGRVAGNSGPRAFLWDGSGLTPLDSRPDGYSHANGMNDRTQIVGRYRASAGALHAFLWDRGQLYDLGGLPNGDESEAIAINPCGTIVGWARSAAGEMHAVQWRRATPATSVVAQRP
jgi:probable HAF family extracellular repeat protein